MQTVSDAEADVIHAWLQEAGITFRIGTDEATELTENQLRAQYKMYIATLRISDDFGLDTVGIQYQQGLKDVTPASDLVEGLLNNVERPPVTSRDGSRVLWEGRALPNFNEVDEAVAAAPHPAPFRSCSATCTPPASATTTPTTTCETASPQPTSPDIGTVLVLGNQPVPPDSEFDGQYVWVYEISGSIPPMGLA